MLDVTDHNLIGVILKYNSQRVANTNPIKFIYFMTSLNSLCR